MNLRKHTSTRVRTPRRPTIRDVGLADLQCSATACSRNYSESCLMCGLNFCQDHFPAHECYQSTSATAAIVVAPEQIVPPAPKRQHKWHNALQKAIVRYDAMIHNNTHASLTFNIRRDTLCRWTQKQAYVTDPKAQPPPPDSVPARPLSEIFDINPEERNLSENKEVFRYLSHKDVDTMTDTEHFEFNASHAADPADDSSADECAGADYWSHVFDGSLLSQAEFDRHYTSEYLIKKYDADLPEGIRDQVNESMANALRRNEDSRSRATKTAWDPKNARLQ
jgi:hypothetical protein